MRFVITGEWNRNKLLQTIVVCYSFYVSLLWITNALLYFNKMNLSPSSVVAYYLGNEEAFLIAVPFFSAFLDEGAGWLVRFVSPDFAILKVLGFVLLQASLATLIFISLWSIFQGNSKNYKGQYDKEP